jgi:protein-tyrosine phosphatase
VGADGFRVSFTKGQVARVGLALLAVAIGWGVFGSAPQPRRWLEVRPGWLYRSAQIPRSDVTAVLREHRIDTVIDLTDEPNDRDRDAEQAATQTLGIRYLHIPVSPGKGQVDAYARVVTAIAQAHERGERVLVHCNLGHRRSAAAIALYARLIERAPPSVAYQELMRFADPKANWQTDVQQYLERHLAEIDRRVQTALSAPPLA